MPPSLTTVGSVLRGIVSGKSVQTLERPAQDNELGILKVSAVTWGSFRPNENKALPPSYDPKDCPRPMNGDILISRANTRELVGAPVMVHGDYPHLLLSDKLLKLIPDETAVDARYLVRALRSPSASAHFFQCAGGSSGSMTNITQSDIRSAPIYLPPLEEQRRTAAILDQAETLRTQRRTALALLDSLTQSLFLDMFGDPVANPKGLPICELQRLCTRITDGTHQSPAWQKSGIPFLFISNIVEGQINFDTHKFISADTHAELTKRCPIEIGDVLYTTVGSYGNAAVVSTKELFAFQRHIAHIKPDRSKLDSRFLAAMIQSPGVRQQVDKVAKGIAQKTVNLADLKGLSVFWPPLPLQQTFATRIASIEALKATHRRALAALDALFASLQQRAFAGAL